MSRIDIITKEYMRENAIFADAFNFLIYQGRQVIDPKQLKELDITELAVLLEEETGTGTKRNDTVQKYRDILKAAVIMQDNRASYIILGIENQTEIHYAMPVRNFIYDALQYGRQVSQKAAIHRKENKKTSDKAGFLSGFYKEDKLLPVVTLVIHFGAEKWDGPLSLRDMMPELDPEFEKYVQDYRIHLIDPARIKPDEFENFSTNLREVMGCIKCSKDKEQLKELLKDNPRMKLEANAARVINEVTHMGLKISEEMEEVDMCKAIEDMMNDSRNLGITEGKNLGIVQGRSLGIIEGEAKGIIETGSEFGISKEDILERLQKKLNISIEKAQEYFALFGQKTI